MKLRYVVTPRNRFEAVVSYDECLKFGEFIRKNKNISFWDFLLLDIRKQLILISYWILDTNKQIHSTRRERDIKVSHETITIDTRDYLNSLQNYIEDYYRYTGQMPKFLFMGIKDERQLREIHFQEYVKYYAPVPDMRNFKEFVQQVLCVTVVVSPFLEGVFLWSGDY